MFGMKMKLMEISLESLPNCQFRVFVFGIEPIEVNVFLWRATMTDISDWLNLSKVLFTFGVRRGKYCDRIYHVNIGGFSSILLDPRQQGILYRDQHSFAYVPLYSVSGFQEKWLYQNIKNGTHVNIFNSISE